MFNFIKKGVGGSSSSNSNSNNNHNDKNDGQYLNPLHHHITHHQQNASSSSSSLLLQQQQQHQPEKDDRDEKDKRKKEKKLRKISKPIISSGNMSTEELLRLDEVRRSLKIRGRRKEKQKLPSGITADYSAEFFAQLDIDKGMEYAYRSNEEYITTDNSMETDPEGSVGGQLNIGHSDSSETSLKINNNNIHNNTNNINTTNSNTTNSNELNKVFVTPPTVPPKPPKRGILKGPRQFSAKTLHEEITIITPDSNTTAANSIASSSRSSRPINPHLSLDNIAVNSTKNVYEDNLIPDKLNTFLNLTSPSLSAESLTDTTNSFATPPFSLSPVGESQGTNRWSRVQAFEDICLPLPEIRFIKLPAPRELIIKRQKSARNDFGFSLRKSMCFDRSQSLYAPTIKPVIFAEPGAGGGVTGLLPGDRLLKLNGLSVEGLQREAIIEMIKNCEESVTVQVQPVSELVELSRRCILDQKYVNVSNQSSGTTTTTINKNNDGGDEMDNAIAECNTLRRSASKRFKAPEETNNNNSYNNNNNNNNNGDGNLNGDERLVWFIHREGFCLAVKLSMPDVESQGKVAIKLLHNGGTTMLTVDGDEIEKANHIKFDLIEDICQLKHLNEASILHCLRQRYANNLIHTRAGPTMIVVNPMAPLSLYSEKVVSMFRGCKTEDMPPHVYSLAQTAYRAMLETRQDQSLIFMGRSGSGKTTSFKHALYYLTLAAGSVMKVITVEKINAINTILEAFGNTKTCLNSNATRFTQIFSLDFDHSGMIASASIQILLLERSRAGRRLTGYDNPFHVLTQLLAGAESNLQKELHLENLSRDDNNPFITLSQKLEDRQKASNDFKRLTQAFVTLNIPESSVKVIWQILAAIYHLGIAGTTKVISGTTSRIQFANPLSARRAANLLGVKLEELTASAFNQNLSGSTSPVRSPIESSEAAWDSLEALAIGIYSEVMAAVVSLINKTICSTGHSIASILLIDTPGFQNPASCGMQAGASINDLQHNYLQERLQLLYDHTMLIAPRDRYAQELVEIDIEGFHPENHSIPLIALIDKSPQNHLLVRTSQRDLREQDRRGLLWLLDEESMYPNSNDDTFIERLFSHYNDREHQYLLRRPAGNRQFILQHLQGTNPVLYSVSGWLKYSREHPSMKLATTLLQDSSNEEISQLFVGALPRTVSGVVFCGSIGGMDGTQSLRRVSSIRRSFVSAGIKRNSIMLQIKFSVDSLIDTIRRTGTHFIHCLLLQHTAGTSSVLNGIHSTTNSLSNNHNHNNNNHNNNNNNCSTPPDIVNVPLLRSQLRGSNVLEAARLYRLGFPESIPLSEFDRRFGLLMDSTTKDTNNFTSSSIEEILCSNDIDSSSYRIGPSQLLLRHGTLNQLEAKRDDLLSDRIIQIQAYCRGHLLRKRMAQKRIQELAVRCIQRNVRAFFAVKGWSWWKLYVNVTPLLNVHRTEEQLKKANDELQTIKLKMDKVENDRNSLKNEKNKLEAKVSELTIDLTEERSASNVVTERLELETAERLKLEKQLHEQQSKFQTLQDNADKLEMELICAKSDLNGLSDDDDPDNENDNSGIYRLKYERLAKELEYTKRRLQTQHEHDLEQLIGLKKQLEKKLADAYEEVEEQRQVVSQWKRKVQKISNEMNDLRMLHEQQNERNNLLEKRQRKFDIECQALQDTARQERQARDRLSREKDVLIAEKFTLEQNLSDNRLELELKEEKCTSLQQDIEELTFGGGTEEELSQLKRAKLDFERKCKDQEEELDELAGQVQLLEQTKLRLEMTLETMRKEARREAQQRDEELEEVRGNSFKKIKVLECQLENEHEERTLLLREKHELERRLQSAEEINQVNQAAEESQIQKLKRDLRKYKALLKDSQIQLDRAKAETPGKIIIRQLRNQVEDAEASRDLAIKARQTADNDMAEMQTQLDEAIRVRMDADERATQMQRDRSELQTQLDENDEEMSDLMKKYSSTVRQLNNEQTKISELDIRISELESEKQSLKEQVEELHTRLESVANASDPLVTVQSKRLELRIKELESRLELEQATRARLEIQCARHKESLEKAHNELQLTKSKEILAQDGQKKLQKSLRELRESFQLVSNREQDSLNKRKDLEKRIETTESEAASVRNDLRLALQRIADLQQAMEEEEEEEDDGDGEGDESSAESANSSDESLSDVDNNKKYTRRIKNVNGDLLLTNKNNNNNKNDSNIDDKKNGGGGGGGPRITISSSSCSSLSGENAKNGEAASSSSYA